MRPMEVSSKARGMAMNRAVFFSIVTALLFGIDAGADIISGFVYSAADSTPLNQVRVSSDTAHFTFTIADGSFTLNTGVAISVRFPGLPEKLDLRWNSAGGYFSWAGYSGIVSIQIRNATGALVAQTSSDRCEGSKYSPSGLPHGFYAATVSAEGRTSTKKIQNIGTNPGVPGALRKIAAIDTLTFVKVGYFTTTRVVSGSQSGLLVYMQPLAKIKCVFVVAMENTDASQIYGNRASAPYLNDSIAPKYGRATAFADQLPLAIVSEPHYVWMEAGTNVFADYTFSNDNDPSATVSTNSTAHLATQIRNATNGATWMSYQEGLNATTGTCPIVTSGFYAPKHDPFVFFQDVSGNPPSRTNVYCTAHHKALTTLAAVVAGPISSYNFITPNQCNDMHGQTGCPNSNTIRSGDDWLRANLPPLIAFVNANEGVIFITWDEGVSTSLMAFYVVGPNVKAGYTSTLAYTHSSIIKSVERILQLPILPTVTSVNDFADFFTPGNFP